MERVERDADGQGDRKHSHRAGPEPGQRLVQVVLEEQKVLEEAERAQADDDGERHDAEAHLRPIPGMPMIRPQT